MGALQIPDMIWYDMIWYDMILYGMWVPVAVWQVRLLTAISVYSTLLIICPAPATEDRGRITKQSSVCIPVSVGRLEQKCVQLATKSSGRPQQLQLCRQRVPCSRCGDGESRVVDSSTCPRHDEVSLFRTPVGERQFSSVLRAVNTMNDPISHQRQQGTQVYRKL